MSRGLLPAGVFRELDDPMLFVAGFRDRHGRANENAAAAPLVLVAEMRGALPWTLQAGLTSLVSAEMP